jgi:hypothetical protein
MALSKAVKTRIKEKKRYRREMWRMSQIHGPHYRIFVKTRLTISYNLRAAQKDVFGELFFPTEVIVLPPWQPTARNIRRAAQLARRNNMANGA